MESHAQQFVERDLVVAVSDPDTPHWVLPLLQLVAVWNRDTSAPKKVMAKLTVDSMNGAGFTTEVARAGCWVRAMEALEPLVERASEPAGARTAMPIHVLRKAMAGFARHHIHVTQGVDGLAVKLGSAVRDAARVRAEARRSADEGELARALLAQDALLKEVEAEEAKSTERKGKVKKKRKDRRGGSQARELEARMLVERVMENVIEEEAEEDQYSLESTGSVGSKASSQNSACQSVHSAASSVSEAPGSACFASLLLAPTPQKPARKGPASTTTASTPCATDTEAQTTDDELLKDRFLGDWIPVDHRGRAFKPKERPPPAFRVEDLEPASPGSMPYDADGERWAEPLASPEDSENEGPGSCAAEDRSADHEAPEQPPAEETPAEETPAEETPSQEPAAEAPAAAVRPVVDTSEVSDRGLLSRRGSPSSGTPAWAALAQGDWDRQDLKRVDDLLAALRAPDACARLAQLAAAEDLSETFREQVYAAHELVAQLEKSRSALWARLQTRHARTAREAAQQAHWALRSLPRAGDDDWFPRVAAALHDCIAARLLRSLVSLAEKAAQRHDLAR